MRAVSTAQEATAADPAGDETRGDLGPRSPIRTLRILELVAESNGRLTLAQLSHRLAVPKTSTFNLLKPLVAQQYLSLHDGVYSLGGGMYRLTLLAGRSSFLRSMRPLLEELSAACEETVSLVMLDSTGRLLEYMEVVESSKPVRYVVTTGEKRPLYCISAGLVLLAFQSQDAIDAYLATAELKPVTAATVIAPDRIRERLARIRDDGYVVTAGEYSDDVFGFAAPVFFGEGQVMAALSIGAPSVRAFARKEAYLRHLRNAAARISAMFRQS